MAETPEAALTTDLASSALWGRRPDAKDDWATTDEDHPSNSIKVLANDKGALGIVQINGNSITAGSTVALASKAEVTLNKDGTLTYDPSGQFEKLNNGETGEDTFAYTVTGKGKATDTATVHMTIAGVTDPGEPGENHPPVANNDYAVLPDYYPYPGPVPLPYEEAATMSDGSISDGPIMTTLALGEEGDPNPYPSSVDINVLANDTDPDGDKLAVSKINGTDVKVRESVTLKSGAEVTLNEDGSLTYSKGIIVYADTDPQPLTDEAVTLAGGELMPIDPILPPKPWPILADSFTYTAIDDDGAESNAATVTVSRAFYDYVQGVEPVASASAPAASEPSAEIAAAEPMMDASAALDQPNDMLA